MPQPTVADLARTDAATARANAVNGVLVSLIDAADRQLDLYRSSARHLAGAALHPDIEAAVTAARNAVAALHDAQMELWREELDVAQDVG